MKWKEKEALNIQEVDDVMQAADARSGVRTDDPSNLAYMLITLYSRSTNA